MDIYERYVGCVFDNRYKIEKIIGIGGMAVVYKATDLLMRREVAVKLLKDEIARDIQAVKRFINESKAVAMLSHPNIVNIYDVSVTDQLKYIVMEYVEGITLKNYMTRRGVLSLREILSYTEQILHALEHAHAKGIVHRDIKPQNIMLLKNGIIKVMDFGIAKLPNAETVTMTDKAIGTVYYISPEQVSGKPIDARSDLYALGVMMYEMSTGALPFTADSPVSVALMQVNDTAPKATDINPNIPRGLEQIISVAMEKDPEDRFQSAPAMLKQIGRLRENPAIVFKIPPKKRSASGNSNDRSAKKRRSTSMFPIILGVTLSFLIVAGISAYYLINSLLLNENLDQSVTVTIRDFTKNTYTEEIANWFLDNSSYYELNVSYVYNPDYEEGKIIEQTPKAGETRKVVSGRQKCTISLVVSRGAETVMVPDLTVRDYREVKNILSTMGIIANIVQEQNSAYDEGDVIRMDPPPGTVINIGDTVTITVSQGGAVQNVVVPDFLGLTEAEALKNLIEFKLIIGEVTYESSNRAKGIVTAQSITAYTQTPEYSVIHLTVSSGKDGILPSEETTPPETEPAVTPDKDKDKDKNGIAGGQFPFETEEEEWPWGNLEDNDDNFLIGPDYDPDEDIIWPW